MTLGRGGKLVSRSTVGLLAFLLLASACSDPATDSTSHDNLVPCSDLDGRPTVDMDEFFDQGNACCIDTGDGKLTPVHLGISDLECVDASFLYWNDAGWGAVPGTWVTSDRHSPPRDLLAACRGE